MPFSIATNLTLNMMASFFILLIVCTARITCVARQTDRQTDRQTHTHTLIHKHTHTHTHNNYCNPRCTCAPRVYECVLSSSRPSPPSRRPKHRSLRRLPDDSESSSGSSDGPTDERFLDQFRRRASHSRASQASAARQSRQEELEILLLQMSRLEYEEQRQLQAGGCMSDSLFMLLLCWCVSVLVCWWCMSAGVLVCWCTGGCMSAGVLVCWWVHVCWCAGGCMSAGVLVC